MVLGDTAPLERSLSTEVKSSVGAVCGSGVFCINKYSSFSSELGKSKNTYLSLSNWRNG